MSGFNADRSANYPPYPKGLFPANRFSHEYLSGPVDDLYNVPQPVMAFDVFWCWNISNRCLIGVPIQEETQTASRQLIESDIALQIDDQLGYANSLAFDGVFINGICGDRFFRVSMYDGQASCVFRNHHLIETQKAAPLVVTIENPNQPYRYFITPLAHHILIVDIGINRKEKFHLFPWDNGEGNDEMRSPVCMNNKAFFLTRKGKFFSIQLAQPWEDLIEKKLTNFANIENYYCFSPVVIDNQLVFEILERESFEESRWHRRGIAAMSIENYQIKLNLLEGFAERKHLDDCGHLPCLTDSKKVFSDNMQNDMRIFQSSPGGNIVSREVIADDIMRTLPRFNSRNAVIVESFLYVIDEHNSIIFILNLNHSLGKKVKALVCPIPIKSGPEPVKQYLIAQPFIFANIMGLFLEQELVFIDVGRTA
jgi:hypothetical protein